VANLEKQSLLACSVREKEKAMKEDKERREQYEYFFGLAHFLPVLMVIFLCAVRTVLQN